MKNNKLKIIFILVLMIIVSNLPDLTINFLKKHKIADKIEYQYIAIINDEEVIADYCDFDSLLSDSFCKYNDYIYYNVPFKQIEINRIDSYYLSRYLNIVYSFGLVLNFGLFFQFIKTLLSAFEEKEI